MPLLPFFGPANGYTHGDPIPIGDKHRHDTHGYTTHTIRWEGTVDEFEFVNLFSIWIEQIGPGLAPSEGYCPHERK